MKTTSYYIFYHWELEVNCVMQIVGEVLTTFIMKSKASTTIWQCNTMCWERSTTRWQRNTTHWQRSTTGWNWDTMRWQRNKMHLQCIDNELQRVFKTQRFCVDFSYARFSQIGSHFSLFFSSSCCLDCSQRNSEEAFFTAFLSSTCNQSLYAPSKIQSQLKTHLPLPGIFNTECKCTNKSS